MEAEMNVAERGRFDLVVFDMDGTLVDTRDGITATIRATLGGRGYPTPAAEEIHPLIGLPLDLMLDRFLPPDVSRNVVVPLVAEYRAHYRREAMPLIRPFASVTETLADLRARGFLLAVATSRVAAMARDVLAVSGLAGKFDLVLGTDQVARPKPAPDLVLAALERLGVSPARTLVVGDTEHDVAMGRSAGALTCAVTYGAQSRAELLKAEPDHLVDDISAVLGIV